MKRICVGIIIMFVVCSLSGCSWVTSGNNLLNVRDSEKKMLEYVFGEEVLEHIDEGKLTKEEFQALKAYRAGSHSLIEKYPSYDLKRESFSKLSENSYEIMFSHEEEFYTCKIDVIKGEYICSDNFTPNDLCGE